MKRKSICLLFMIFLFNSIANASNQTEQAYSRQPAPEVEVTGRVVGSDFPEIGIAEAEVTLTGMGTYTGITDEDGYFMIDNVNSNNTYELVIVAEDYQVFTGEAVIGADDTDLGDIILNQITFPAYDVVAVQNEYETVAEITWQSPEQGLVNGYNLYLLVLGDEENEDNWILVAEGISDTFYNDPGWETMDSGVYRYAVKAEYMNNVLSDAAFSNWLGKDMLATLELSFTTNTGAIPEGAVVMLNSTEPDPDGNYPSYEAVTDEIGECVISDVWKSNYDITAELEDFSLFADNIDIYEDTVTYEGMLVILFFPPYDVTVIENHDGNAWLTWHSPEIVNLAWYNIYRGFAEDQANYEDWDFIAFVIQDTTYEDVTWPEVTVPGEYLYCVRVLSEGGLQSEPAFSNIIYFGVVAPVTINITSNSGDSTDGAEVNLCNQDGIHLYDGIVAGGAVYWQDVFLGIYDLEVIFPGYETYLETDILIMDCLVLNVVLAELINPPVNLEYDQGTGILSWDVYARHFEYYNIYLDNELVGQTVEQIYDLSSNINPNNEYIAGVSAYYSSNQESEIIEIIIPNLDGGENVIENGKLKIENYPNPFNPETKICFEMQESSEVLVNIYNLKGQKVETLVEGYLTAGEHNIVWNAVHCGSGIYLLHIQAAGISASKKVILLK
ncbi:MAG: carboxypeptidase regulatory-like domain-containing protein [Candidatus Cloacimonetes bacterium]|nr:carboxypeptidase regulatory-like domain-containing protein [Candidatus Cloacimonadota bacterium]